MKTFERRAGLVLACLMACGLSSAQPAGGGLQRSAPARATSDAATAAGHITRAVEVLRQMQSDPALAEQLGRAQGAYVVPHYGRVALGLGAGGGGGVLLVRQGDSWTSPAFYTVGGISAGAQAGVQTGPVVLLLNTQKALDSFRQDNKFALNAQAGLTVVNWSADAQRTAGMGDVTVWSSAKGLFGGALVSITDVHFNQRLNSAYYGHPVAARDILAGQVANPREADLRSQLAELEGATKRGSSGTSGATSPGDRPDERHR
ncbi:MAG: lipid-binding SYLF domain-containing protein [Telluria sp.]